MEKFKFCIVFGDIPALDPVQIAPGWEMSEIPVALLVKPFESEANWQAQRAQIETWHHPSIKVASHFIQFWGLMPMGPKSDWEQLEFWAERALRRLGALGVEFAGLYGGFFRIPEDVSRTQATDQALRWLNMLADYSDKYNIKLMLEPQAEVEPLFPMTLEGLEFARKEIGRPSVCVMADLNYFIAGNQPLEHIAVAPETCAHVHIAGDNAQPGVGDRVDIHTHLFRALRDIKYTGGDSAACPWVSTHGEKIDFYAESAKALSYLRDKVYVE